MAGAGRSALPQAGLWRVSALIRRRAALDIHPVVAQTAPSVWQPLTRYVQFHGT